MTECEVELSSVTANEYIRPGYLLAPFGWAAQQVAEMAQADGTLLVRLFELDTKRMHLMALVLAISNGIPSPQLTNLLAQSSARVVLDHALPDRPAGLLRALDRLPAEVLSPEGYRHLVELLDEPYGAKILRHARAIDDSTISNLCVLPPQLRSRAVVDAFGWLHDMTGLVDALHLFADRGVVPSFEAVLHQFTTATGSAHLRAKVRRLVEALPLPDALPPVHVGPSRRIDQVVELRTLAKRWHNCLANYAHKVDQGDAAVYLWEETRAKAVCLVERRGRLGWFLKDVKGRRNSELNSHSAECARVTFAEAGMPPDHVADAIDHLIIEDDERLHTRGSQQARRREERLELAAIEN